MPEVVHPRRPVDNWEQVREEWIKEVDRVLADVEAWSHQHGWATLRDQRTISEDRIGSYQVPVLLVHTPQGRLILTPEARYVVGAHGLIDVNVYPSFDALTSLVKTEDGWRFKASEDGDVGEALSADSFRQMASRLLESP